MCHLIVIWSQLQLHPSISTTWCWSRQCAHCFSALPAGPGRAEYKAGDQEGCCPFLFTSWGLVCVLGNDSPARLFPPYSSSLSLAAAEYRWQFSQPLENQLYHESTLPLLPLRDTSTRKFLVWAPWDPLPLDFQTLCVPNFSSYSPSPSNGSCFFSFYLPDTTELFVFFLFSVSYL